MGGGEKHDGFRFLQKLGLNGREANFNNEPIHFVKPTLTSSLYSLGRKGINSIINWY